MSVGVLVRRNVLDPVRSRSIWILLGTFAVFFGMVGYLVDTEFTPLAVVVREIIPFLAPLAALGMTYDSIAGPRQSGSLRVLLSYPYTRRELVLGTLAGRVIVVGLAVVVGVLVGILTTVVFGGGIDVGQIVVVLLLSLLLSTAIVGLTMGISASVRTSSRAAVLAFGAYLLFSTFWGFLPQLGRYVLNGFSFPTGSPPAWVEVWGQLNPITAFRTGTQAVLDSPASEAIYHGLPFAVLVLVGWFVLSTVVGLLRFERTDL